jgi:uncharacterized protein YjbJ (UPF0337 family)
MNRDEIRGKTEKAKGYIKEEAGELLDDPELEAEGRMERASGKVRESFGQAKEKVKEQAEKASEAIDDVLDKDEDDDE